MRKFLSVRTTILGLSTIVSEWAKAWGDVG